MTEMGLGKCSQSLGQWNDMDHDILVRIFERNPQPHLLRMVCRSWRCACFDALFWKFNFLDMSTPFFIDESSDFSILDHDIEIKLMNTIKVIFEGDHAHRIPPETWSQSICSIRFPRDFHISDEILLYIAQRTPNVKFVFLPKSSRITERGFLEAIAYWKEVVAVEIGPIIGWSFTNLLQHMNMNWNKLSVLKISDKNFELDEDHAITIAKTLPRLMRLCFTSCRLHVAGLKILLNHRIERIDTYRCDLIRGKNPTSSLKCTGPLCKVISEGLIQWWSTYEYIRVWINN